MILVAEAFARGNSKTDGFKSRLVPVPKAATEMMFGSVAVDLAKAQVELIGKLDVALRDGLVLVAANAIRENGMRRNTGTLELHVPPCRPQPTHCSFRRSGPSFSSARRRVAMRCMPDLRKRLRKLRVTSFAALRPAFLCADHASEGRNPGPRRAGTRDRQDLPGKWD